MPPMDFDFIITVNGERIVVTVDEKEAEQLYDLMLKRRHDNVKQMSLICRSTYKGRSWESVHKEFKNE